MQFGDKVTNICAGENNPMRHCYFVSRGKSDIKCTDKKGRFFDIGKEVIYPGHLDKSKCKELFKPIWEAEFGK